MAINKVVYGNQTLVDLTQDSVEASNLLEGETAHDRSGTPVTGTAKQGHIILDRIKTALTQRSKLWFKGGLKVSDDSTEGATVIDDTPDYITFADWNAKTDEQKNAYVASHPKFAFTNLPDTEGVINAEYMKLLWENPNTTQAFVAQTVTLNSADYDFLIIIYKLINNASYQESVIIQKGKGAVLDIAYSSGSAVLNYHRLASYVSDISLSFDDCYLTLTSGTQVANISNVPIAIYGIKKNFQFKVNAIATDLSTRADHCFLSDGETSVEEVLADFYTEDIKSQLTSSYGTITSAVFSKAGRMATLTLTVALTSNVVANTALTTLPSAYRPVSTTAGNAINHNNGQYYGVTINANNGAVVFGTQSSLPTANTTVGLTFTYTL